MTDPAGGPVICHNDVCLENVVFLDGLAVALLELDFAAPGRSTFDLAAFARMYIPIDDEINSAKLRWQPADRPRRSRLVCDTYGLDANGRAEVLRSVSESIARGGEFVQRHAEAGEPGFMKMWTEIGGMNARPPPTVVGGRATAVRVGAPLKDPRTLPRSLDRR